MNSKQSILHIARIVCEHACVKESLEPARTYALHQSVTAVVRAAETVFGDVASEEVTEVFYALAVEFGCVES